MEDLWEEFFAAHRDALESDRMRQELSQVAMAWRRYNLAKRTLEEAIAEGTVP